MNIYQFPSKVRVRLIRETTAEEVVQISSINDIQNLLGTHFNELDREVLICIHLSASNTVLGIETVSIGTLNSSLVHPREVFKGAILSNAASIVICHNHPSGSLTPSAEDFRITETIKDAGKLLDINLLDHVLFAGQKTLSILHHTIN